MRIKSVDLHHMYSPSIQNLIKALKKLPSVGERTAERYVFHLLKSGKKETTELMLALKNLTQTVTSCKVCWNFSDSSPCSTCKDPRRDHGTVCVVEDPQDLSVIEHTGDFRGVYHVLRGLVDPTDEDGLKKMKIKELIGRVKFGNKEIKEIILALNPDMAGETTMLYLEKELKKINPSLIISRLARGLPLGSDLKYADEITLGSAIKNRVSKG
ncbi:MAG: recombination protein RecR [Candidatus Magasanikbacteria bacterium]|nr:recombination protein RecR [Candidatus Magasanikbacteria bacterium]